MQTITADTLLGALNWRYATKRFDLAKKIPAETWAVLEQTLVLTPSAFGLEPWQFIVVQDPALRAQLCAASWGQTQPIECSHFVVFALRKNLGMDQVERHFDRLVEVRGGQKSQLQGLHDVVMTSVEQARSGGFLDVWQGRQLYIALGQFLTAAALLGVDACPMEGLEPARYDEILNLAPQGLTTLCACAAGYRSPVDKTAALPKVRFPASEVIAHL